MFEYFDQQYSADGIAHREAVFLRVGGADQADRVPIHALVQLPGGYHFCAQKLCAQQLSV